MKTSPNPFHQDVALAALFVSTKMQDTLKKPRDLLAVSYAVRFPELAAKTKHPTGEIDIDTMDPAVSTFSPPYLLYTARATACDREAHCAQIVEQDRQKLLAIERLLLETICFNFTSRLCFPYVIKIAKRLAGEYSMVVHHRHYQALTLNQRPRKSLNWRGGCQSIGG